MTPAGRDGFSIFEPKHTTELSVTRTLLAGPPLQMHIVKVGDVMTPDAQRLVRDSFAKIAPNAEAAAGMFYDRLFALDPSLRPLFKDDMTEQRRKLMTMIGTAVANLDRLDTIVPAVRDLGRRHAGYGVAPSDYQTVAAALLWTLEQGLGDEFTLETRQAWVECYTTLASTMQQAVAA